MKLILDVGCGDRPVGDVNCDLFVGESPHWSRGHRSIDAKSIPNFVRCDCNALPFRDRVFSECYCSNLIEHEGVDAVKTLREMVRVCSRKLTVLVPHRYAPKRSMHDKYFTVQSLHDLFRKLGLNPRVEVVGYRYFPHSCFSLFRWFRLPNLLRVESVVK